MSPTTPPLSAKPWWRLIDWRLVAAIGLPLWAFVLGIMVRARPAEVVLLPPPPPPPIVQPHEHPGDNSIPPPREIVVRPAEPVAMPVVVPVPVPGEPVAADPPEFQLPATELLPVDGCQTFGTQVRFHKGFAEATAEAKAEKKMLFVLHISGHFDDPGFT